MAVAPKQNALQILARLVPLNTLDEADLGELLESAAFEKLKKGAVLFHQGDTDSLNVYLLSGRVALLADKREMDLVDARDDTARFPLAHQFPRKFTAVARTKVEVVRIDNRRLGELIARSSRPDYEVSAVDGDVPDDWMSQLLQLQVFQQLPPANIQRVIMGMEEQSLEQGEQLFQQGDMGDYFYLINKGQCRIVRTDEEGEEELARLGPGDSFGEESLLSGRPRAGTAVMLTDGVVARLEKQRFLDNVVEPLFRELSFEDASRQVEEGALWLDVRQPAAFEAHHLPASLNLPLSSLRYQASSLDPERRYLICGDDRGDRLVAAYLLMGQGIEVALLRDGIPGAEAEEMPPEPPDVGRGGEVVDLQGEPLEQQTAGEEPEPLQRRLSRAEALARSQGERLEQLQAELEEARERLRELEQGESGNDETAQRLSAVLAQNADLLRQLEEQATRIKGLNAERETAEACLADLEQTIEDLQGQLGEGRKQNDELKRLQRELEQAQARHQASAQTVERLEREQEKLRRGLADAEARSAELERRLGETEQAAGERDRELRETRDALDQARREAQEAAQARDAAQTELTALGDRLQRTDEELAGLRRRQQSLEEERETATGELAGAKDRIQELEQALARQEQAAREAEEQAETLRQRLVEQEAELTRLSDARERLEAAERRVTELESQLANGERASESLQQELERLRQRQRELEQQVERLDGEKAEADGARQTLETELRQREETLDGLRQEREAERRRVAELEAERDALAADLKQSGERLAAMEGERAEREEADATELDALRRRLEAADEALAETNRERDAARERLQELERKHAAQADELEQQRQRLAELEQALEHSRGAESEELASLRERLQGAERSQAELDAQRRETEQRLQRLEAEKETLASELADAREAADRRAAELESEREEWQRQRQELEQSRDQAQAQVAELERRLEAARTDQEEARTGQQQLIEHLQQELAAQKERVDEAGHALIELELQKGRAEDELQGLRQRLQEREMELAEQTRALSEARAALSRGQGSEQELEQLRAELEEMRQARDAAERALEERRADAGGASVSEGDTKGLQAEIKTLTDALEESERSYEEMAARVRELEAELATGAAGGDAQLLYEKQAAEQEVERLRSEVETLRSTMEEYVHQIQAAREAGQDETAEALRTELALVREQAEADLAGMRDELEALRAELQEKRLAESADISENEALRKEIDSLQRELEQQRQEVDEARSGQHRLLEDVELQKGEISRLKEALEIATVEAEEAEFKRKEEIDARRQLEENLLQLQQEMGESRARELLQSSPQETGEGPRGGRRGGLIPALAGALLAFVVAEGLSIAAGGGELVTGLLRQVAPDAVPLTLPDETPSRSASGVDQTAPADVAAAPADRAEAERGATPPAASAGPAGAGMASAKPIPAKAGKPIRDRLNNGLRAPAMLPIPGGTWIMGSERDPLAVEERPAHEVTLKPFAIGRTEVTFDQYDVFARDTGRRLPDDQGWGRGKRPVIDVTWEDAQAYARWLSRRTGQRYRLPTEAEWEYAAAGGSADYFWWGYEPGEGRANCFNCGSEWDGRSTAPVDAFAPNPYGLISTAGNVMEWVEDCYHPSYHGAPADGSAWIEPGCSERSVRGGAYSKPAATLRTTYRSHFGQKARLPMLGFRLVRELR